MLQGRSRLLERSRGNALEVSSGRVTQAGPGGGCGGHGDAGAGPGEMDLTRRQRDQRKKDIREKVRTSDQTW